MPVHILFRTWRKIGRSSTRKICGFSTWVMEACSCGTEVHTGQFMEMKGQKETALVQINFPKNSAMTARDERLPKT
jgi:hypothetical protein